MKDDSKEVLKDYIGNPFIPMMRDCDKHGPTQRNVLDDTGHESWYSGCPKCIVEADLQRVMGRAAIPARFIGKTLENYEANISSQKRALEIAKAYADGFALQIENGQSLIFCGKPGTGKTHLAAAILNQIIKDGYNGMYTTVINAVRRVKETWSRDSDFTEREAIKRFVLPDLLVLDEVGVQFGSEAERLIMFEIINGRYEEMRPTLLMSNLALSGVEENIGPRVIDRLRENGGRIVVFDWDSYRTNKTSTITNMRPYGAVAAAEEEESRMGKFAI